MRRAITDPEEIRKFAHFLLRTANQLRSMRTDLLGKFNDLHDHWQDQKYGRFREMFTNTMNRLESFARESEGYAQYLHKKAQPLEDYLRHRY
jgi:hypothetical protein